jgi:hypothetical protein
MLYRNFFRNLATAPSTAQPRVLLSWCQERRGGGEIVNEKVPYPGCIRELYESEIFGEAVFLSLVAIAKNPREKYQLGSLLQLETETKARLRPFLFRHGISLDETTDLAGVAVATEFYQALSWPEFTEANIPIVQGFLSRFEAILELGPAADKNILQSMVDHEASILKWVTMESDGITNGSLEDVIAQLRYPLAVNQG